MEIVKPQWKKPSPSANDAVSTLPLYRSAPSLEVRLEDFELYAIDRLRVLKGISDGLSRGKRPEEMEKLVKDLWKANMRHPLQSEVTNKDIISHFVLRLVYCRTEELRKWFLSNEIALFRYRFQLLSLEAQRLLMAEFDLPYKPVTTAEFEGVKEKLQLVARSIGLSKPTASDIFYKVPFEEVPELVAGRRVFIYKGYAYVAMTQVVSLVATQFRGLLSKALVLTNSLTLNILCLQKVDIYHQRTREGSPNSRGSWKPYAQAIWVLTSLRFFVTLYKLISVVFRSHGQVNHEEYGSHPSQPKEFAEVSIKDIDQVAKSSFPPCMRHLFEKLREDHHLKHGGRMQLGLFLKGVGLKLDDALAFWKAEFSQKVGAERFDKEYAYSIRHNYGREGKRTDYTPYSCQKIISSTPGVGDHHGCPYRHFSEENLRAALGRMGVNSGALENVMDKVQNRHYQLACTLTFESIHGSSHDAGINHPNQYFSDSQKIFKSKWSAALSNLMLCSPLLCSCGKSWPQALSLEACVSVPQIFKSRGRSSLKTIPLDKENLWATDSTFTYIGLCNGKDGRISNGKPKIGWLEDILRGI
ncbi:hypothetical protein SADUNF_Sadunf03G0132600 [Salix dunnii]|uniref:DNA primase large subunit C-terminal domain-containing protein n=1 Tax=Salix dunnii TaxID=1413687 RepID=A0A835N4N6_9ROSI|nr:hypothetical protein SADUNF_Sadunf03G0132600 [Salix dunnii]